MTRNSQDIAWRRLLEAASAPYRQAGRFAWHFARGKLGIDPVFRHLLSEGLIAPGERVLDIGCGQGLLASLLLAAGNSDAHSSSHWPPQWPPAPQGVSVTGIELMPRDVQRARDALGTASLRARFVCADMREAEFPPSDAVVILDVLHYVDHETQDRVLERVRDALGSGGRLLLRVGDAGQRRGFAISQYVDRLVTRVRGHKVAPTYCRPLQAWIRQLQALGFAVEARPMSQGVPFANVLLVARREMPHAAAQGIAA